MKKGDNIIYTVLGDAEVYATITRAHRDGTVSLRAHHWLNKDGSRLGNIGMDYKRVTPAEWRFADRSPAH